MVDNVNTQIYDGRLNRAALLRLYENNTISKVDIVMDGHVFRLDKLIKNSKMTSTSFKSFEINLNRELKRTYREVFSVSKRSLLDLASDQVSYTYQNLEAGVSKVWRTKRPQRRIAEEIVLKQPLHSNKTLEQGWVGISAGERKRLSSVIRKGIAEGDTPEVIARNVRKGNIHKITRNQSRALVTTSITSVAAQADHEVYAANGDALKGWQYVAVLDSRTTPVCSHRDGHIYPIGDTKHLPPAHYRCRSTTTPVVKSWDDLSKLEGVNQVRKRNLKKLNPAQVAFYDGLTPLKESYNSWLLRQPTNIQVKHLGSYQKVDLFNNGKLSVDKFTAPSGAELGIRQLRQLTDSEYTAPSDTKRFALAKERLDAMHLGASRPEDFIDDIKLTNTLRDYYVLQSAELDGTLSLTNYRGNLIGTKRRTKNLVLNKLPREDQLLFNPITGRYEDSRLFQPAPAVLENNLKLVNESLVLKQADKDYIIKFIASLESRMSVNERAVVADNLRILFTRYRKNPEVWTNFKAVSQAQIKFDVMNVSDSIETQLRKDANLLKKLKQDNYIDPVLGAVQLDDLSNNFINNISKRNRWEDKVAPKLARQLRDIFDRNIPIRLQRRIPDDKLQQFYLRFAHRLSLADSPDVDNLAVSLGRDLYNMAELNGTKQQWHTLGKKIIESNNKFFKLETFGVQKRRMKSRLSGQYFGPYYDTFSYNIRITDPRIQEYSRLNRSIDVGLRIGVTDPKNRLLFREGYKTYFYKDKLGGYVDTRIPITSSSAFRDFPEEFIDKDMVSALNWAAKSEFKVDEDYYDFVNKLLNFADDRGRAQYFDDLNQYRRYIISRGDSYERFKSMQWFRDRNIAFSNHPFIDSRARIYDRGFISPQSGETFRPFLNTSYERALGEIGFKNFNDQIGSFLGGLDDFFEGRFNSLSITGRQKIANKWRPELVKIGNHMIRGKPNDIRAILQSDIVAKIEGEELGKFLRFAIETAKIDNFMKGDYKNLSKLNSYKTALALEQDASSSGAQIIALTTRNKQLAELSNVIPTNQKKRLYDEIAAATFNDSRFRQLNLRLGINEKDLRKAAKAQNMVTFYGAGDRTGILNVERKLASALERQPGTLVVKASQRDEILGEISARIARFEKFDPETAAELAVLRTNVRDIFNKGLNPGQDIMDDLYFLSPQTKDFLEKMSLSYDKVITPNDFKEIASIMSEYLAEQTPVLKTFTKFLGRLAEDFLENARPSKSDFDWKSIFKVKLLGTRKDGYKLPDRIGEILGVNTSKSVSESFLSKFGFWKPNGFLDELIYGTRDPLNRRIGAKYFKIDIAKIKKIYELEIFRANKLPKRWTNVPWVNFDKKTLEQNFTSTIETRLFYRDKDGNPITNIIQIDNKSEATWWEQFINNSGNINDIADTAKARTAYAVNGTHSNDAVLVKRFHIWGRENNVNTATVHDAFFTNIGEMLEAKQALRNIYAKAAESNVIKQTLDEMRARGFPKELYDKYLNEAIEIGLIPIPGKSRIGGRLLTDTDILTREDILRDIDEVFEDDLSWYGVGG